MGTLPATSNWSVWDAGATDHGFGDMMSQGSMRIAPIIQQPATAQSFYNIVPTVSTPNLSQLDSGSKPRSDVSSLSNASPESRSLEDDFLNFDSINSTNSRKSNSNTPPNNRLSSPSDNGSSKVKKRTLNTLAARRYRQKRVDQMSGLETALKETETERDDLKLKVARLEAEVEVLRRLVGSGAQSGV